MAVSSTPTTISLKWTAADDRVNYYPAREEYQVVYTMNDIPYILQTHETNITVPGLEPNTEYTFLIQAVIDNDNARGPVGNLTSRTAPAGELY